MTKPRWVPDSLSAPKSELEDYKRLVRYRLAELMGTGKREEFLRANIEGWQRREAKLAAWAIDGEDDYPFKIPIDAYQIRSLEMWLESLLTKLENEKKHAAGSGSKKTDDPSAQIKH